jgi:hypothetical protein
MTLIERLLGREETAEPEHSDLAHDARAMRATLDRMRTGNTELDLRAIVRDLLEGEVAAPTVDIAALTRAGTDPAAFYDTEIAPSWDGLSEAQRAARLEGFLDMCQMIDSAGDAAGIPEDMARSIRTKTLLAAWAFDETYGYLARLGRGEPPLEP